MLQNRHEANRALREAPVCVSKQVVRLVRDIGGITVRGNHDELALERYDTWQRTGALDVRCSM